MKNKKLSADARQELLEKLQKRFEKNSFRHEGIDWKDINKKLEKNPEKLWSLNEMERTGGEPDVVKGRDGKDIYFVDCSPESPSGRRSFCYDHEALEARKEHKPADSAMNMAGEMGIEMLGEEEYRMLQETGEFDLKTSSWLKTPDSIRKAGGAIFGDRRFGRVFIYHNGASSYYAGRAFRGMLKI